ncbi:flagellar filament capping protein FliD [Geosporobacter ferrireducens]|uniref:flagellar filament capping protein FliD n=1 Tax=Geosporobacter ferrireducens TaxID=1424294 RepID=UPI00139AD65E|nr:flagellar filament capping protein FliD [Geosporobacter ferrireducens]MTI53438.1 flagellar hook protein [Geosporobacter ferrireducens]
MSSLRISGIASGLDTQSIIQSLMKVERAKVDRYGQNKQLKLWKQETYNSVNKDFANFVLDIRKELEMTKTSITGGLMSNSSSNFSYVKKVTSSNESAVSVSALASATPGSYTLEVKNLATGVSAASSSAVDNITLGELFVDANGDETYDWSGNGGVYTVEINGKELQFDKGAKVSDVVKKINSEVDGVNAGYDATAKRVFISTVKTGSEAKIKIDENAEALFNGLKLTFSGESTADGGSIEYSGINAKINFNGAEDIEYSSNNFTINGIQIELKAKTESPVTINVNTDVDGVYDKIKTFVDKYNELIAKLNSMVREKPNRDYKPLTAEQKESMSDDEIKKWEEKAKAGMLYNDSTIQNTLATMRLGLYSEVEGAGKYNQLTLIGINTGTYDTKGKLIIDEEKLKKAIADDPESVMNLFFQEPTATEGDAKKKESGLINRLFDDIVDGMKELINKSGTGGNEDLYRNVKSNILVDFVLGKATGTGSLSYLDKDILDIEKSIYNEESRLVRIENAYWTKFTAMEKALQQMNSQSSWISQQLGSL